jgi:hypothetical protein
MSNLDNIRVRLTEGCKEGDAKALHSILIEVVDELRRMEQQVKHEKECEMAAAQGYRDAATRIPPRRRAKTAAPMA